MRKTDKEQLEDMVTKLYQDVPKKNNWKCINCDSNDIIHGQMIDKDVGVCIYYCKHCSTYVSYKELKDYNIKRQP